MKTVFFGPFKSMPLGRSYFPFKVGTGRQNPRKVTDGLTSGYYRPFGKGLGRRNFMIMPIKTGATGSHL
jgi:hypothetical protein